jgi:predicted amidohydrolase
VTRQITIAAVQLPAVAPGTSDAEKQENNFRAAEHWLDQAGQRGTDIACLGETFNILGLSRDSLLIQIPDAVDNAVSRLGRIARRHHMIVIAPVAGLLDDVVRNAAIILDRTGQPIGHYLKVHCTESERALGIVPGDSWPTFAVDFGQIGVQICHDNSFPESARCLALNGAEIIFWPHTMSGWGDEFMDVLMRGPSVYNGVYHVPVCFGCDPGQAWRPGMLIGRSSIIGPDGIVLADAGRQIGIALAQIDLDAPRIAHDFTREGESIWRDDMRRDRRPDTYSAIIRPVRDDSNIPADRTQLEKR